MGAEYDDDEVAESVACYAPHAPVGSAELLVRVHGCGSWYVARRLHLSLSATERHLDLACYCSFERDL